MSAPEPAPAPHLPEVVLDFGGVTLQLRVFDDPSGLRGQVFDGEEKVAGVQVFHTKDVSRLVAVARRDAAVHRGVERRGGVV
jgi:hypothetical protein